MMKKEIWLRLLKQFSTFCEKLTEADLADLENGNQYLVIELHQRPSVSPSKKISINPEELASRLERLESRDEVKNLIKGLKKTDLIEISKYLDLPIHKSDTSAKISEKITEAVIGYKLRSKAIQQ